MEPCCASKHSSSPENLQWLTGPDLQIFNFQNRLDESKYNDIFIQASSSSPLFFPLFFFFEVLLGMLVSNGERGAKFIFFSDSVLTMNEAAFTKFLPTLMCLC